VAVYGFTITEYDPEQPWVVVSTGRDSVELADADDFFDWVRTRWPAPRFVVRLDRPPLTPWSR
jgi:hypothetical protein